MIKEDWIKCKLGDLLTLKNGFAFKSSRYTSEGIPVIRIGDINDWIVDESQAKCIAEEDEYDKYIVKKGDILIAMSGATTGKFGIYNSIRKAYQNQRVGNLKLNSKKFIDKKYIFNLLYSLKFQIEKDAYGGAQPNISAGKIHALKTVLAPLPEQRAIVAKIEELFSDLDKGIADLKKAQNQLKIYRQAVLKKAFEGGLTKKWRENRKLKLQQWHLMSFGEATNNFDGKRKPLSRAARKDFQGIYPYYGACEHIDNVKEYIFDGKYMLIGEDGANLLSKSKPLSFIVEGKFWVNNHAHVIQPKDGIDISFLNHQFNSLHINEFVTGTAQPKLNQRNLNKIPVKIPSMDEQHQIVQEIESRLSICDKVEEGITESLEKAEALRQSILKKAFEGRLLSNEELKKCKAATDYEPASVLLQKIKNL